MSQRSCARSLSMRWPYHRTTAAVCAASDELDRGPFSAARQRLSSRNTYKRHKEPMGDLLLSLDKHLSWMSPNFRPKPEGLMKSY